MIDFGRWIYSEDIAVWAAKNTSLNLEEQIACICAAPHKTLEEKLEGVKELKSEHDGKPLQDRIENMKMVLHGSRSRTRIYVCLFGIGIFFRGENVTGMQGYGVYNQPMGTWSDDTSLTLALMDSIVHRQAVDCHDIMDKFSEWLLYGAYTATEEVFDVGGATSRAIMNYGHGMNPLGCGGMSEYENGNGSLMRILPSQPDWMRNLCQCRFKTIVRQFVVKRRNHTGTEEAFQYYTGKKWEDISAYDRLTDIKSFAALPEAEIRSSGDIEKRLYRKLVRGTGIFAAKNKWSQWHVWVLYYFQFYLMLM